MEPIGWVLYDGECGVCARWVPFWAPRLSRLNIGTAALQEPWVRERLQLDDDALRADIRLLFADSSSIAGADVYRYVMRRIWWAWPVWVLASLPVGRQIFDRAYRGFADRRLRISRACGLHPHAPG